MEGVKIKRHQRERDDDDDEVLTPCSKRPAIDAIKLDTCTVTRFVRPNDDLNVIYYPLFVAASEANRILKLLTELLAPYLSISANCVRIGGKTIPIPRKQTAFGEPGLKYSFSGITLHCNPWLPLIKDLKDAIEGAISEKFNFVLVNYYRNGLDYIGEHRDDEKDLCPESSIASLSFGCERDFVFRHSKSRGKNATRKDMASVKLCLNNGSLLVMRSPTNKHWYHSLPVRKNCHRARINLTFRHMKT